MLDFFIWGGVIIILDIIELVMSKMRKVVNIRYLILGMLISGIMFGTGTYAATVISGNNISYVDNANLGVNNVQAAIDGTCTKFSNQLTTLESTIIDKIYPVGSIYISETDSTVTAVQNRFGGTWVAYGSGKTLVGSGTGTDVNGTTQTFSVSNNSKNLGEYTHKLTISEIASHSHGLGFIRDSVFTPGNVDYVTGRNMTDRIGWSDTEAMYGRINAGYTQTIGGDGYHNNIQPYITVYMYKRTK